MLKITFLILLWIEGKIVLDELIRLYSLSPQITYFFGGVLWGCLAATLIKTGKNI